MKFEEIKTDKGVRKTITINFKKWGVTLLVVYLCLTSFFTALYLQNTRLTVKVGNYSLLK